MMPLVALRTLDGQDIPLDQISPLRDAQRLGASPATIASILASRKKREGLEDSLTASMLGTPARQMYLRETVPYSQTVAELIQAEVGSWKHSALNLAAERVIANVRVFSKRYPWLSGELDNAAIVDIRETEAEVVFVLDVYDVKSGGWYAAKKAWQDPFGPDAHSEYAWQLNCLATLLEEQDDLGAHAAISAGMRYDSGLLSWTPVIGTSPTGRAWRIEVRNLYLEWPPRDSSYKHESEAQKLGIPQYGLLIIPVPRRSAEEVYARYEKARAEQVAAREQGWAPICSDRWSNNIRCMRFCSVKDACIQGSLARGEWHPLATVSQALEASIKEKEKRT